MAGKNAEIPHSPPSLSAWWSPRYTYVPAILHGLDWQRGCKGYSSEWSPTSHSVTLGAEDLPALSPHSSSSHQRRVWSANRTGHSSDCEAREDHCLAQMRPVVTSKRLAAATRSSKIRNCDFTTCSV